MIISEQWLRQWIELKLDSEALVERLTMAGLEVDSVSRAGPVLPDVVVGRIKRAAAHPDAGRLRVCEVDIGKRATLSIVCGAANARPGLAVAVALPGAELPNGLRIERRDLRGVTSTGMLCSGIELGLDEEADSIIELDAGAVPGQRLDEALAFDDALIDIDLTPNRGDCLSILGIARELAVLTGARLKRQDVPGVETELRARTRVELQAGADCPRYVGRRLLGLERGARTPVWMAERLRRCGLRPLSPVVDVTNYVMLELGQPMHAFDAGRVAGGIRVRRAEAGESLTLLDATHIELDPDTMVIADHGGPIALAGIMGGAASAISADSTEIILEAAHFRPQTIAGRARRFGIQTDSSFRFERGVDPLLCDAACHYASWLIREIAGGQAGPLADRRLPRHLPRRAPIRVWHQNVNRLLGSEIPKREARAILARIGAPLVETAGGWRLKPPSYRFDLSRECDLIEEIARVRGYAAIPARQPWMPATARVGSERDVARARIRQTLVERGFCEAISYSFVAGHLQARLDPEHQALALANPLTAQMDVMRTTLWAGLLPALIGNLNRQHARVRLFETGKVFHPGPGTHSEVAMIGGAVSGAAYPSQWGLEARRADFFDVKSDLEALLALGGEADSFAFTRSAHPALHPGQSADLLRDGETLGRVGRLHPALERELDIEVPVYVFELRLAAIERGPLPAYTSVSRFPAIRRDLSLTVASGQPVAALSAAIRDSAAGLLEELQIFDLYQPAAKTSSTKSIGFGLTLRDSSRTLKDQEVEKVIEKILDVLRDRFSAELRT